MKRLITVAVLAAFTMGLSTLAFAADGKRFDTSRKAVEAAGIKVLDAAPGKDTRGKEILVLKSTTKASDAVAAFRELYNNEKSVAGLKVVGMAHMVRTDTWNVTLRDGDTVRMVKIAPTKDGSKLLLRQPFSVPIGR